MTPKTGETPNHTFIVENFTTCETTDCHDQDMTGGGTAKQDYDGDGTIERTTAEVEGLLDTLKSAIETKAGTFESSRGAVVFAKTKKPKQATYAAAYNYFYVMNDKSRGIHNIPFTVDLLTRSIIAVGGELTSGGTGGSGTTGSTGGGTGGTTGSTGGGTTSPGGSGTGTGTTETSPTSP